MNTDFRRLNFRDKAEIKAGVKVLVSSSRSAKSAQSADKNSQHGIALVVTLILVSVTAFLAMTFLILSQRERGSVSVSANQTDARAGNVSDGRRREFVLGAVSLLAADTLYHGLLQCGSLRVPLQFRTRPSGSSWPRS